jgi:peroxiredoxin
MPPILHDPDGQLTLGQPAPAFSLPDTISGKTIDSSDYKDAKALVVIFSCNHCPWVIKYEERMSNLAREFTPKGVAFVVISSNDIIKYPQDGPAEMKKRALQKDYPFPYLYDESQSVAREYGALVTPHVFAFDSKGILRYRGAIDDNPDSEQRTTREYLHEALEAILAGNTAEIAMPTTRAVGCSVKWK